MATKPFKFRYVNQIVGTSVGAVALVVVVGTVFVGRAQKWFQKVTPYTLTLPFDGSYGLKVGGEVRMMGVTIGAIDQVDPPKDPGGRMTMRLHIDPRYAPFIRGQLGAPHATAAIIHTPPVLGDAFLELTRGQGQPLPPGTDFPAAPEAAALGGLIDEYTKLAVDLRSQQGPMQQTLRHIDALASNLERTDSVLGRLTADKELANRMADAVARLSTSADQLHAVMADLQKTSAGLPEMVDQSRGVMANANQAIGNVRDSTAQLPAVMASLKQTVDTLPGVMAHTQQSLVEVEKLVKGMQALPLIRDHVDAATPSGGTLKPTDVGDGS